MFARIWEWVKGFFRGGLKVLKNTVVEVVNHAETAVSMAIESIGWVVVLSALPLAIACPIWLEADLVIPFLAVGMTLLMATITVLRSNAGLVIGD